MSLQIGKKYVRVSPDGIETPVQITNHKFLTYYKDLEKHGFKFKPVPVIHKSVAVCESCEG